MQLSAHYTPYKEPVVLTIVGNTCARFIYAKDRTIEEVKKLDWSETEGDRSQFFVDIAKTLKDILKKTPAQIDLCAIEIEKGPLSESIEQTTGQKISRVIAKNLSSLPLEAILRILHEQHGA